MCVLFDSHTGTGLDLGLQYEPSRLQICGEDISAWCGRGEID